MQNENWVAGLRKLYGANNIHAPESYYRQFSTLGEESSLLLTIEMVQRVLRRKRGEVLFERCSAELLLADLQVLRSLLTTTYGGYNPAAEAGFDWNEFFAEWILRLSSERGEVIVSKELLGFNKLFAVQQDNHFGFPFSGTHFGSTSHTVIGDIPTELQSYQRAVSVFENGCLRVSKAVTLPFRRYEALTSSEINHSDYSDRALKSVGEYCDARQSALLEFDSYTYLRVPTGTPTARQQMRELLQETPSSRSQKPLIVDLRFNSGMCAEEGIDLIVQLAGIEGYAGIDSMISMSSLDNAQTRVMAANFDILTNLCAKKPEDRLELPEPEPHKPPPLTSPRPTLTSKRPIVGVIDRLVASDGEAITRFLKNVDRAVLIGENTAGVGQFTQPGFVSLPHTGLIVAIPRGYRDLSDYGIRSFEGYGFSPDIYLSAAEWSKVSLESFIGNLENVPA